MTCTDGSFLCVEKLHFNKYCPSFGCSIEMAENKPLIFNCLCFIIILGSVVFQRVNVAGNEPWLDLGLLKIKRGGVNISRDCGGL